MPHTTYPSLSPMGAPVSLLVDGSPIIAGDKQDGTIEQVVHVRAWLRGYGYEYHSVGGKVEACRSSSPSKRRQRSIVLRIPPGACERLFHRRSEVERSAVFEKGRNLAYAADYEREELGPPSRRRSCLMYVGVDMRVSAVTLSSLGWILPWGMTLPRKSTCLTPTRDLLVESFSL